MEKRRSHPLIERIYVQKGADEEQARRIISSNGIPAECVAEIPRSHAKGERKLQEERAVMVLKNRSIEFVENFKSIPEGALCYRFMKFSPYEGCPYWCEYCFLFMTFAFRPQFMHNVNYNRMLLEIDTLSRKAGERIFLLNAGELGEPLAVDDITGFSKLIVPFVAERPGVKILFLTKSATVENLLNLEHKGKTIFSSSINCNAIAKRYEHRAPTPEERLRAAQRVHGAGYEVRLRFDPLFAFEGWEREYAKMVEMAYDYVKPSMITLGEYRPSRGLKGHIKSRFPNSSLFALEKEMVLEAGKKRFPLEKRAVLYNHLVREIRRKDSRVPIALCKETGDAWERACLDRRGFRCNCIP